mgnify:CR=1 FL=1
MISHGVVRVNTQTRRILLMILDIFPDTMIWHARMREWQVLRRKPS